MRAIVDGVASDHETNARHMEAGGVVGICVAKIDRDKLVTFKVKRPSNQPFS